LGECRSFIKGKRLECPAEVTILLSEGTVAVDEAIASLSKLASLQAFVP
jgi:hypothetical protein